MADGSFFDLKVPHKEEMISPETLNLYEYLGLFPQKGPQNKDVLIRILLKGECLEKAPLFRKLYLQMAEIYSKREN